MLDRGQYEEKTMEVAHSLSGNISPELARELVAFMEASRKHYQLHGHHPVTCNNLMAVDLATAIDQACEIVLEWERDEAMEAEAKIQRAMSGMPL